jgi:hypothetical protein
MGGCSSKNKLPNDSNLEPQSPAMDNVVTDFTIPPEEEVTIGNLNQSTNNKPPIAPLFTDPSERHIAVPHKILGPILAHAVAAEKLAKDVLNLQ